MKKHILSFLFVLSIIFICCIGCEDISGVNMPYSSQEYRGCDWTVEELVSHFEEMGFSDIEISNVSDSFGEKRIEIYNVTVEDTASDSLFTEYRAFEKGEELSTWLKIKIETHTFIPTLTVKNCSEFLDLVQMDASSPQKAEAISAFMALHNSEYLEFDGVIADWYDEMFWTSVSFAISVEESDQLHFSWNTIDFSDLDLEGEYEYSKYKVGLISENMKVHMIAKITSSEDEWNLEIESMQIVE